MGLWSGHEILKFRCAKVRVMEKNYVKKISSQSFWIFENSNLLKIIPNPRNEQINKKLLLFSRRVRTTFVVIPSHRILHRSKTKNYKISFRSSKEQLKQWTTLRRLWLAYYHSFISKNLTFALIRTLKHVLSFKLKRFYAWDTLNKSWSDLHERFSY